ncbi:hypothetical protein JNJ66_05430 [Candidatus Saccharibacteria bacterium]|nr:hypothetical protein [Candidatus Saccharibacteria bacterium]
MGKSKINVAIVIDGGDTLQGERKSGLLQEIVAETGLALADRDTDGIAPVVLAGSRVIPAGDINLRELETDILLDGISGVTRLAPAIEAASLALPAGEPGAIAVVSDFQVADEDEVCDLVLRLGQQGNRFLLNVRVSDAEGGADFAQKLDDLGEGENDVCDTVHATDDTGARLEDVRGVVGRELDEWAAKVTKISA